jgi:hypothetical protein
MKLYAKCSLDLDVNLKEENLAVFSFKKACENRSKSRQENRVNLRTKSNKKNINKYNTIIGLEKRRELMLKTMLKNKHKMLYYKLIYVFIAL